jgi:hypothetical protein
MLKHSLLAKIYAALEKSPFTVADFLVEEGDEEKNAKLLLSVRFRHQPEFVLQVQEHENLYYSVESPGDFRKTDTVGLPTLQAIPERLAIWARNVRDELRTVLPAFAEIESLRATIDAHLREHLSDPDERFSKAEADDLREKLDALAASFSDLADRSEITKQELNRVQQELTAIKANLANFPKATWYKTAGTKMWSVTSRLITSAESRQLLAQAARKALGMDGPQ